VTRRRVRMVMAGSVALAFVACLLLFWGRLRSSYEFACLRRHRKHPAVAAYYAERLRSTRRGVDLALGDLGLFDTTRGWSSWIVEKTPLSEYVESRLKEVGGSSEPDLNRRIAALLVLWRRTRDSTYLEQCFLAVKDPGGPVVDLGRFRLSSEISDATLTSVLRAAPSETIPMESPEFGALLARALESRGRSRKRHVYPGAHAAP